MSSASPFVGIAVVMICLVACASGAQPDSAGISVGTITDVPGGGPPTAELTEGPASASSPPDSRWC